MLMAIERRWLVAIFVVGLGIRFVAGFVFIDELSKNSTNNIYFNIAQNISSGHGYASSKAGIVTTAPMLLPLYPSLLAIQLSVFGEQMPVFVVSQSILGLLTLWVTYLIGCRLVGKYAALIGASLLAVHPYLIWAQVLRFHETSLTVLLSAISVLTLLCLADHEATWRRAVSAGMAIGLFSLTRETGVAFVLVACVWLFVINFRKPNRQWTNVLLFLLTWLAFIFPWVARNWQTFGTPFLSINKGLVFYQGHNPIYVQFHPNYDSDLIQQYIPKLTGITPPFWTVENDQRLWLAGISYVISHPTEEIGVSLHKLAWAYAWFAIPRHLTNSQPYFDVTTMKMSDRAEPTASWQEYVYSVYWVPVLLFFMVGLFVTYRQWHGTILLIYLLIAMNAFEMVAAFPDTRFRMTVEPYIVLIAGRGVVYVASWLHRNLPSKGRPANQASTV